MSGLRFWVAAPSREEDSTDVPVWNVVDSNRKHGEGEGAICQCFVEKDAERICASLNFSVAEGRIGDKVC